MTDPSGATLARRLGTRDAVVVGLGAMLGAGVFAAFGPAASAAGAGLLVGLVVAAVVAWCNALSSAQLAARYPTSGGTYVYGRERLGPWWGFAAGWCFVIGKTASCAAMALTFAGYVLPEGGWSQRALAATAVAALAAVNLRGITRTAALSRVLVAFTLVALLVALVVLAGSGHTQGDRLRAPWLDEFGLHGVLQAAGFLFFAFAGYARVATLGEEVRDPSRTIPRAITLALAIVIAIYAAVAVVLLSVLGPTGLAEAAAPVSDAVRVAGAEWAVPVVQAGAAVASLGALLALVAGVGRTGLAMARNGDLPRTLAAVSSRWQVPHHAEVAVAAVVIALVLAFDVRTVIAFSSFGVLLYYGVANASALTLTAQERRLPPVVAGVGVVGCVVLVLCLPWPAIATGVGVLVVGLLGRLLFAPSAR
ncbi:APC family permease [Angustibacter sp. McL0619]|uniref:APC family permease n=1 Tax=Angustibacter sp. McL0619 TaxID=3415676 RepID=UPI003CFB3B26